MKKAWLTNYHSKKGTVLWKLALQARRTIFFYKLIHEVLIENKDLLKGLTIARAVSVLQTQTKLISSSIKNYWSQRLNPAINPAEVNTVRNKFQ